MKRKIKVLIIENSSSQWETLQTKLSGDADLEIAGEVTDAASVLSRIENATPDVIVVDITMWGTNGTIWLQKIIRRSAAAVIVVGESGNSGSDYLNAGATDFIAKPDPASLIGQEAFVNELKVKIKVAPTVNRNLAQRAGTAPPVNLEKGTSRIRLIAIGASTGGTEALYEVIKNLPKNMPGILIVQHMPAVFTRMYAERLDNSCVLTVKEAEDGDPVYPGRVLIAPGDLQMRLKKAGDGFSVSCTRGERVSGHCPSVDVLFHSVAEKAGAAAAGVILTGMGSDGARGLQAMRNSGARTIGQDQASCVVYGMPKVAYDLGAVEKQLPLVKIAEALVSLAG